MAVESKVPNYLESYLSQYTESVSKLRSNLDYRSVVRGCDFKVTFGKPLTISLLTGEETESLKYCRDLINLLHTHIGDDIVYRYFKNRLVCRAKPLYDEWEDFNSQKCSPNEALLSLTEKVIGVVQNIIYLSKDDSRELNLESLFPDQIQNFLESSKVSENPEENIPKAFEFACSSLYDSNWRMSTSRYRINRIDYLWATSIVESEKFKDISIEKNNDLLKKLFFHTLDGNLFSKYIFCSLLEHKPCDFNVDKFIESLGKEVSSRYRRKTYRKSIASDYNMCNI